ncbi:hypothetical protein AB0A77_36920 [Streptomyces varsoviensis]|uniref:hypothetical protein n=1 Tax=Streptomyces varsoviensis TaxID=67373 RepID=UPI00340232D1
MTGRFVLLKFEWRMLLRWRGAVGELAGVYADPVLAAFDLEFYEGEALRRRPLGADWNVRFEQVPPARKFRWPKGGGSFAGWYYAATTGAHVGYESWLERDRLILLDADTEVAGDRVAAVLAPLV